MKKVKKFGRGGDIVTGIGAALLGKALYDKYNEKKGDSEKNNAIISGEESPKYDKDKLISKEVTNAQRESAKGPIERSDERIAPKQEEQADVRPKSNTGSTTPIQQSKTYDANAGQDRTPVKGVDEKKLEQLQRRNAPTTVKKKTVVKKEAVPYKDNADRPSKPYSESQAAATKNATNSSAEAFNRKARAQNLGASYAAQYSALQRAPEGPGKEALKKAVAKAKQDYEDASKGMKRGGAVKKYAAGGSVKATKMGAVKTAKPSMRSASSRADGIAIRGKTRA